MYIIPGKKIVLEEIVIAASYKFFLPEPRRVVSRMPMTILALPSEFDGLNDHVRPTILTLVSYKRGCDNRLGSQGTVTVLRGA